MAGPQPNAQMRLDAAHVYDDARGIGPDHWCRPLFEHIYCAFADGEAGGDFLFSLVDTEGLQGGY